MNARRATPRRRTSKSHTGARRTDQGDSPALQRYRAKRNFRETPEPSGSRVPHSKAFHFVVQKHAARRLHYDFRLELEGTLKSWAVPKGPSLDPSQKRLAVHVEDHPLEYADFEGVIPPNQYGSGTVVVWDRGLWEPVGNAQEGYEHGRLKFRLYGQKLRGTWNLVRMGRRLKKGNGDGEKKEPDNWLLIKDHDREARRGLRGDVTKQARSVSTGRTIEQVASDRDRTWRSNRRAAPSAPASPASAPSRRRTRRSSMQRHMSPQLATLVERVPEGDGWIHELKYDGYRILCAVKEGRARLFTRNGHDWTAKLHHIASAMEALPVSSAWFDGEVVAMDSDGGISFQTLQNAFDAGSENDLAYYVFDLLSLDGEDLRSHPLLERKRRLESALAENGSSLVRFSDHITGHGDRVFAEACARGMEGLVCKQAEAPYVAGRNRHWVKVKCGQRQEFVIGGYTDPSGSRAGFGALLLGVYEDDGRLRYAGKTGTGFSERSLKDLHRMLSRLEQDMSPFADPPLGADARGVHWVKPELVAEVAFAQWTSDGLLRQASFQGLRTDKEAGTIMREQPKSMPTKRTSRTTSHQGARRSHRRAVGRRRDAPPASTNGTETVAGVSLTHPRRVLYPEQGLTKINLARYYERVSDWILPHLSQRPLMLVRCPEGHGGSCFYQKHATESIPDAIRRIAIRERARKAATYMVADTPAALIGLVQMGVLEIHTWGARRDNPERPDRIIMDLDPDPAVSWGDVIDAATLVHGLLEELGLRSFVKTTGGKGLHIAVPLQRVHSWDEVKSFSKSLAEHLARVIPDRFVANMAKRRRAGKIYLDYLRNARGATAVAAYSTRAKPGAPVSVPLDWSELSPRLRSDHFTVTNLPARLEKLRRDPWHEYFRLEQRLTRDMKRALQTS
ncbi:ATP-dependent DNA ligase [Nitrospira sp.]|nr:ATP-dependent DNA ligase [Nitrospira sp.]